MRFLESMLIGFAVLVLVMGFFGLWAGEVEVLPSRSAGLEGMGEGKRPGIPSRAEFEIPDGNTPGAFYLR